LVLLESRCLRALIIQAVYFYNKRLVLSLIAINSDYCKSEEDLLFYSIMTAAISEFKNKTLH
jgi:hypothetical protein